MSFRTFLYPAYVFCTLVVFDLIYTYVSQKKLQGEENLKRVERTNTTLNNMHTRWSDNKFTITARSSRSVYNSSSPLHALTSNPKAFLLAAERRLNCLGDILLIIRTDATAQLNRSHPLPRLVNSMFLDYRLFGEKGRSPYHVCIKRQIT